MDEEKQAQQEETSPEVEEEQAEGADLNMIEQAEAEAQEEKEKDTGSLLHDAIASITRERERIEEKRGEHFASAFESFSILQKALEDKSSVERDLKKVISDLWSCVKGGMDDGTVANLKEVERTARSTAMAWMHVAAICQIAENSV